MILSVLLGFLSYKYVEKIRFRNDFSSVLSYFKSKPIYIALIIGVLGSILFLKSEALTPYRFTGEAIPIIEQQQIIPERPACADSIGCIFGDGPIKAIVIGDSHARAQNVAIGNRAKLFGGSVLSWSLSSCLTVKDVYSVDKNGRNPDYKCGKLVSNVIDISSKKYPNIPVIIINRTSSYIHGGNEDKNSKLIPPSYFVDEAFSETGQKYSSNITNHMVETICEFAKTNPVHLVKPIPEIGRSVPEAMFRNFVLNDNDKQIKITRNEYKQRQNIALGMQDDAVKRCDANVLDPLTYLCDSEYCHGEINGIPLYYDDNHLSSYGAEVISPIYDEVFRQTVN